MHRSLSLASRFWQAPERHTSFALHLRDRNSQLQHHGLARSYDHRVRSFLVAVQREASIAEHIDDRRDRHPFAESNRENDSRGLRLHDVIVSSFMIRYCADSCAAFFRRAAMRKPWPTRNQGAEIDSRRPSLIVILAKARITHCCTDATPALRGYVGCVDASTSYQVLQRCHQLTRDFVGALIAAAVLSFSSL